MNKRLIVVAALASAVATPGAATTPVPPPPFKAEKCYGIARAGENDCASTGNNECAGTSRRALDPRAWIYLPEGHCNRIQGGSLTPQ